MDPKLENAVREGNVKFLKEAAAARQSADYFLYRSSSGNIFHMAAWDGNADFLKAAMNILPTDIQKRLLLQTTKDGLNDYTALHIAALTTNVKVILVIREMFETLPWTQEDYQEPPWRLRTKDGKTPLNIVLAVDGENEKCALEIMLMDPYLESSTLADADDNTPIYYAVKRGFNVVAEKLLMSPNMSISSRRAPNFLSLLRLATNCSGNVVRLLLEKCDGYLDNDGNTPLHSALHPTSTEERALEILSTYPALCKICNNKGESPFFLAVRSGYVQVVYEIMRIEKPRFHMLRCNDGTTVLDLLSTCPVDIHLMLLENFWWIINLRDYQRKTALDYVKQVGKDDINNWIVDMLTNPSLLKKQDFDWMEACKREESDAILAFVHNCQDLKRACCEENDTLLHHVKLTTYKDYHNFLRIPAIADLKNTIDYEGATPLHRALEKKDMHFVKALLLDAGVERNIRDHAGTTSMDLLAKLCKENDDWERMCKQINVNPYLRTTYILPRTNLEQMRTTLSVIAALLATITFAAGFTLPGGINSDNGQPVLGKKAAFLVFLLADAYAMCTSMLVLFCLVWSMVSEHGMACLLVDRSVFILMQSLYATLLVFMTGIYVVIEHTSLWAAIVIFVMCSIIGITANRTILHKVIAMLVPAAYREKLDHMRLLEEGNAGAFTAEEDKADKRE